MTEGLPLNWASASLADLCQKIVDGSHNPPPGQPTGIPMLSARNIDNCQILFDDFRYISKKAFEIEHARTRISQGDVLLTIVGSIGRAAVVPEAAEPFALQRSVAVLKPLALTPRFCMYQLQSPDVQRQLTNQSRGTAQKGVYLRLLGQVQLRVPSLQEQNRIVEEIEKQFTRLDAAVAALKRVQANLKRYRAAVLKAACEGRLVPTEAELARREGRSYESASVLLERILAERRSRWEAAQRAKFRAIGKEPPIGWKMKYREPSTPDTNNLPLLPQGWGWATLDQLTVLITSGSRGWKEFYSLEGALFIRSQDINTDSLEIVNAARVRPPQKSEGTRTAVRLGDLLVTITGANVAKTALVGTDVSEAYVSQHVGLIRLVRPDFGPLVHMYAVAPSGGRKLLLLAAYGAGKPGLNLDNLRELPIPLPPVAERKRVVESVQDQLSVINHLERELETKLKTAHALRQSILRHAFAGKLVPQDPNDEPASALLERIRGTAIPGCALSNGCALPDKKPTNTSSKGRAALSKNQKHTARNGCATKPK